MSSTTAFSKQIEAFVQKTERTMDETVRELLILLMTRIDQRSPIGEPKYWKSPPAADYVPGLFRGSWMLGVNRINNKQPGTKDGGRKRLSVERAKAQIPSDAAKHVYYYTNSVPYAMRLEYGWSYRQAPYGIIAVTSMEFRNLLFKALKKAKA